jgi:hypothetical protein
VLAEALPNGAKRFDLDVRALATGTYQVLVTGPGGVRNGKLVVMH